MIDMNTSKILLISTVKYNSSIWGRHQEVANNLGKYCREVIFLEPIVYHSRDIPTNLLDNGDNPAPKNVKVINRSTQIPRGPLYVIYSEIMNLLYLIECNPDIIIVYSTKCLMVSVLARLLRKKLVFDYVDDLASLQDVTLMRLFVKYFYVPFIARIANVIIVTAHQLKNDLIKYNKNIFLIPNGVDLEKFTAIEYQGECTKDGKFTVGFIGSLSNWVDIELIYNVAKELHNIDFVFIGNGDSSNHLRALCSNLSNVHILGPIPHNKIPQAISSFNICIIPFKINYLTDRICPVKLFEYWASKKPVISTAFLEIQYIGENKVIVARNENEFIRSIELLIRDSTLRTNLSKKGYIEVAEKYDWAKIGTIYRNIIGLY